MILTIAGADFSGANIGQNNSVRIFLTKGSGVDGTLSKTSLEKGVISTETQIATLSLKENYENLTITVKMNNAEVSGWVKNGTVTIPANTNITGNISISASATAVSGGEVVDPEPEEPGTGGGSGNTPIAGTLFDFDFVNNTIDKYVSDGIITIPSTSKTDTLTYDSKGMTTTSTAMPAALGNGVKLTNPFDLASQSWAFEVTMTMDVYDAESMGTSVTEVLYPNIAFFSATEHGTLPDDKAHGSNCLAPAIYINGGKFSGRFPQNGNVTIGTTTKVFYDDGLEHTFKWQYDKDTNTNTIYKDGVQVYNSKWTNTTADFGGSIQYLLGVHAGYSSGKNFCIKKGMHIKNMKMYTL